MEEDELPEDDDVQRIDCEVFAEPARVGSGFEEE